MAPRKRRAAPVSPLAGRLARVGIERNGMHISVEDVEAPKAFDVLAAMIEAVRQMIPHYPELAPYEMLENVGGGYSPMEVPDDDAPEFVDPAEGKTPPALPKPRPVVGF